MRARKNLVPRGRKLRVGGVSVAFRDRVHRAAHSATMRSDRADISAPCCRRTAAPWNFRDWPSTAPAGLDVPRSDSRRALARLAAGTAAGGDIDRQRRRRICSNLATRRPRPSGIGAATTRRSSGSVVPAASSRREQDRAWRRGRPAPGRRSRCRCRLANDGDIAFAAAISGPVPPGPRGQAPLRGATRAARSMSIISIRLEWLAIDASGTLRSTGSCKPMGSFSVTVAGYDQLLAALPRRPAPTSDRSLRRGCRSA